MGRLIEASPLRIKDQTHKTALLQSKMASPRYDRADREGDRCSYEPVIHSPPKIMYLKCDQPVFGQLHPSRLSVSDDHVHLCFQSRQLLQNSELEFVGGHTTDRRRLRPLYRADFII